MSNKPAPVALTAAALMQRLLALDEAQKWKGVTATHHSAAHLCASLASQLHRLRPCARLDKRLAKLNAQLEPLALIASRGGDPRGNSCLTLVSTDANRPLPRNGGTDGEWTL